MAEGRGPPNPKGRPWTNVVECPHHPEAPLIEDHSAGDMICQECGLVVGDRYGYRVYRVGIGYACVVVAARTEFCVIMCIFYHESKRSSCVYVFKCTHLETTHS